MAERMIPWLWLRIVLLIAFAIFVTIKGQIWIAGIAVVLLLLTLWQLKSAQTNKATTEE